VRFEKTHEETYRDFGLELVSVEPGSLVERVSITVSGGEKSPRRYPAYLSAVAQRAAGHDIPN
jgi:hypothetical protein